MHYKKEIANSFSISYTRSEYLIYMPVSHKRVVPYNMQVCTFNYVDSVTYQQCTSFVHCWYGTESFLYERRVKFQVPFTSIPEHVQYHILDRLGNTFSTNVKCTLIKPISDCLSWQPLLCWQKKLSLQLSITVCSASTSCKKRDTSNQLLWSHVGKLVLTALNISSYLETIPQIENDIPCHSNKFRYIPLYFYGFQIPNNSVGSPGRKFC